MATVTHAHPHHSIGSTDLGRRIWAIVGGSSGNLVEWYDFYVYSFTALYFASEFFPAGDQTTQLLNAAGGDTGHHDLQHAVSQPSVLLEGGISGDLDLTRFPFRPLLSP